MCQLNVGTNVLCLRARSHECHPPKAAVAKAYASRALADLNPSLGMMSGGMVSNNNSLVACTILPSADMYLSLPAGSWHGSWGWCDLLAFCVTVILEMKAEPLGQRTAGSYGPRQFMSRANLKL
jgi:hypothetical protein